MQIIKYWITIETVDHCNGGFVCDSVGCLPAESFFNYNVRQRGSMHFFMLWFWGVVLGAILCGSYVESDVVDRIQKEAIEAGVGRYNGKTSEFEFIKNTKE